MAKGFQALLFTTLLLLISCSNEKTRTQDEARSDLIASLSFASEAELLIDEMQQSRVTEHYADGHLDYLIGEIERLAKQIDESSPEAGAQGLEHLRTELQDLTKELITARLNVDNPAGLAGPRAKVDEIRRSLQRAQSSL